MKTPRLFRVLFVLFTVTFVPVLAQNDTAPAPVAGFIPKEAPAITALVLYGFSALIMWIHFFRFGRRPFMLTLTIGMTAMTIGFVLRILYLISPYSTGRFIPMDMFLLLSPCAFLATDYMLLARLTATFDKEVTDTCLLLRPSRIVKIFVWSDAITFLLQATGGGMSSSSTISTADLGNKITMVGLCLQLASFALFTVLILVFGWRIQSRFLSVWSTHPYKMPFTILGMEPVADWRILYWTVCVTCIGILIRSIFRIAEFAEGYSGYIVLHEGYFYIFDSLPLWISMTLYCVVWPTRFLSAHTQPEGVELKEESSV
ncbi:RTA1 like protein-domain-containing protein [Mycena galericulata]|nr:RTA1 like protein-domain-containing protein [Mycena galericulata]